MHDDLTLYLHKSIESSVDKVTWLVAHNMCVSMQFTLNQPLIHTLSYFECQLTK